MKQTSDQQRTYLFGSYCVRLRKQMRLSQRELAQLLGLSTPTIQRWEHGVCLPTQAHLARLMALALQRQAFTPGQEYQQAEQIWQAAEPQTDFQSFWMQQQLSASPVPRSLMVLKQERTPTEEPLASREPPTSWAHCDWGEALDVHDFYGRDAECSQLHQWVLQERCRLVNVLGMGGIGKSALVVTFMHQVASSFQRVVFRSIRNAPPCLELLADCLQALSPQPLPTLPMSVEQSLDLLMPCFQSQRCLLVLDNLESLLQEQDPAGGYRPGYEDYALLLRRVAETDHQSCLLLTGREIPAEPWQGKSRRTGGHTLSLGGLDTRACEQLFAEHPLMGTAHDRMRLAYVYAGNPLALNIVAKLISDLFGGEIAPFLEQNCAILGSIWELLAEQFARLSDREKSVLIWLAIAREPLSLTELHALLVPPISEAALAEAMQALQRRSLVEQGMLHSGFTLQPVVLQYATEVLVERDSQQILQGNLTTFTCYALEQARSKEYVRQAQERMIVAPILTYLQTHYQQTDVLERQLLHLLDQLRGWSLEAQGYGPTNLMMLIRALRGHLRRLDLSRLAIRGAYFQQVEMQDATLAGALIQDSIFTETLDPITAVAISGSGQYWATSSERGKVHIWSNGGQILHLVRQAHTSTTFALVFSPDERLLASGSLDGSIRCWEVANGTLLWSGWPVSSVGGLAFAPDGSVLTSAGGKAIIFWDPQHGTHRQDVPHPLFLSLAWSPDGHMLVSGDFQGQIRVWQRQDNQPLTCVQTIMGHRNWVMGLAFSPDGKLLASGSWDSTVKLWEVASGRLHHTFVGHTDRIQRIAWSPDGRILASCSYDHTIRLWDVEQNRSRLVLQGHTSVVNGLAFTPDGLHLLSGSHDGTLRVWDVAHGQCIRIIQGYPTSPLDIDWSPDGTKIASAGADTLITIWDLASHMPPKTLRGHKPLVYGVAWSPDGKTLASSGWDNAIRLWEPITGRCIEQQRDPDHTETLFCGLAWSPNGKLLAVGTFLHGILIWDVKTCTQRWLTRLYQTWIRCVAWSPDGSRLASGGEVGHVHVWDITTGSLLQQLQVPEGYVMSVAWSSDGTWLASAGHCRGSGNLLVWDAQSWGHARAFTVPSEVISSIIWNPSGKTLISGGCDGTLHWWDVQSGACMRELQTHQGAVQALKVSPDGQTLASCGDDGTIMLWNLHTGQHLCTLRRDRPYERLDITGIKGLTQAQKETLKSLGAIDTRCQAYEQL